VVAGSTTPDITIDWLGNVVNLQANVTFDFTLEGAPVGSITFVDGLGGDIKPSKGVRVIRKDAFLGKLNSLTAPLLATSLANPRAKLAPGSVLQVRTISLAPQVDGIPLAPILVNAPFAINFGAAPAPHHSGALETDIPLPVTLRDPTSPPPPRVAMPATPNPAPRGTFTRPGIDPALQPAAGRPVLPAIPRPPIPSPGTLPPRPGSGSASGPGPGPGEDAEGSPPRGRGIGLWNWITGKTR
jgi:hypothetical protein